MVYRIFNVFEAKHQFVFADERVAVDAPTDTAISNKILEILEDNKDKLIVDPKIVYSMIFAKPWVTDNVAYCMYFNTDNQTIWERYLMPVLTQADMHVKVFAR